MPSRRAPGFGGPVAGGAPALGAAPALLSLLRGLGAPAPQVLVRAHPEALRHGAAPEAAARALQPLLSRPVVLPCKGLPYLSTCTCTAQCGAAPEMHARSGSSCASATPSGPFVLPCKGNLSLKNTHNLILVRACAERKALRYGAMKESWLILRFNASWALLLVPAQAWYVLVVCRRRHHALHYCPRSPVITANLLASRL